VAVALLYKFRGENFVVALASASNTLAQNLSFHSLSLVDEKKKKRMQAVEAFGLIHIPATEREIPTGKSFQNRKGSREI